MLKNNRLFTLLFVISTLISLSQATFAKDTWTRVNSKNFHLIGNASEKDIRKVATKLEQFRESFRLLFNTTNFDSAIPTNVIVFKSSSAYKPFKPKRADGKIDDFVAGYFMPGRDVNYITLSTEGEDSSTYRTIFHEYIHFVLNTNFGKSDIPAWFNEGLAEYYETFEIEADQKIKLGLFQQRHLELLSQNKLMPLDSLFNISNYALHQNGNHSRSIFYAQSWALIHFLFQTGKGDKLTKFLQLLTSDIKPEKAFQDAFQTNYATMEKELKSYVSKTSYQYQIYPLKQKLLFDADMKVSPLAEPEVNSYLGDLLYHTNRFDDAEPFLQKTLAVEPNSSMANTTMGMVKMRQRKFDEAKNYFEKGIAGDVKNAQAYYNYAYLLSREGQDEFSFVSRFLPETASKMREALNKSITLNPSFTPSYELYAFISLVNNEKLEESVQLLKKALKYQPGDQQIILRIAEILFRQEKTDDAKYLAEKIAKTASEPEVKSRADNLLSKIQSMLDVKARNEAMRKEYEAKRNEYEKNGGNKPTLTRRQNPNQKVPTAEEIETARQNERILSINQALKPPQANEKQIIGRITKISCPPKMIVYSVKTESGVISLFSKDFQNLTLVAFDSGAENAQVGCNKGFEKYNSVLTYKPSTTNKSNFAGELIAIDFVPDSFRFMKEEEQTAIGESSQNEAEITVSEPSAPTETVVVGTPENFEEQRRQAILQSIKKAMREPQAGEIRRQGMIEKIECDKNGMFFLMKTDTQLLKLKSFTGLQIKAFTNDIAGTEFGCGLKQFDAPAVFTYKENPDKKSKLNGDLIFIEFVPKSFKLD